VFLVAGIAAAGVMLTVVRRQREVETWQPSSISWGRIIRLDTAAPNFWWIRLRMRLGGLTGGQHAADQIVRWQPRSARARYNLGVFLYATQPERARQAFVEVTQLDPGYEIAQRSHETGEHGRPREAHRARREHAYHQCMAGELASAKTI